MKKPKTVKTILLVMGSLLVLLLCLGFVYRQSIRNYRQRLFVEAALRGEITRMRFLLAVGASVDDPACQTSMCAPPLVAAAFNRSTQPVQLLLDEGSNVNDKMPRGQTAPGGAMPRTPKSAASVKRIHPGKPRSSSKSCGFATSSTTSSGGSRFRCRGRR